MTVNGNMKVLVLGYRTFLMNKGEMIYKGGTEVMTDYILKFCKTHPEWVVDYCVTSGGVVRMGNRYKDYYGLNEVTKFTSWEDLVDVVNDKDYDLIIHSSCMDPYDMSCIQELYKRVNSKILVYTHGTNVNKVKDYGDYVMELDHVSIVSATAHEYYDNLNYGIPTNRQYKINNCVGFVNEPVREHDNGKASLVASVIYQKGVDNVIEVVKSAGMELNLIGKSSAYNLSRFVGPNTDMVNYLGTMKHEDVMSYVADAKFTVFLPNKKEGNTLAVLESMAVGTPVITWNDFSYPDFVSPYYNILLERNDNFVQEFVEKYLPKLDEYLDYNKRLELSKLTLDTYGFEAFVSNMDDILVSMWNEAN